MAKSLKPDDVPRFAHDPHYNAWEHYRHHVDLHYMHLKSAIFSLMAFYAVTGGILSVYFLHIAEEPLIKYALILPLVMSLLLAAMYFKTISAAGYAHDDIEMLAGRLNLDVFSVVAAVLQIFLKLSFAVTSLTALGLLFLILS